MIIMIFNSWSQIYVFFHTVKNWYTDEKIRLQQLLLILTYVKWIRVLRRYCYFRKIYVKVDEIIGLKWCLCSCDYTGARRRRNANILNFQICFSFKYMFGYIVYPISFSFFAYFCFYRFCHWLSHIFIIDLPRKEKYCNFTVDNLAIKALSIHCRLSNLLPHLIKLAF